MRKTHKKILGFLSLGLVVAMTVFAATLPVPGAKATTSTSITDVITVTVIGQTVKVDIVDPESGSIFIHPNQGLSVEQEHAKHIDITGVYTDPDGNETAFNIGSYNPSTTHDTTTTTIDLDTYGYGTYTITATGTDETGVPDSDIITFSYIPIKADIDDSDIDGDTYVDLDYEVGNVCSANVNIYLDNKLVTPPSPIHVEAPTTRIKLPIADFATGDYTITTTAYDCPNPGEDPKPLPYPYTDTFHHDQDEDVPVPDTGGFFMGMNISKTDYLITAIIVFFAFAVLALLIVIKGRRKNIKRR